MRTTGRWGPWAPQLPVIGCLSAQGGHLDPGVPDRVDRRRTPAPADTRRPWPLQLRGVAPSRPAAIPAPAFGAAVPSATSTTTTTATLRTTTTTIGCVSSPCPDHLGQQESRTEDGRGTATARTARSGATVRTASRGPGDVELSARRSRASGRCWVPGSHLSAVAEGGTQAVFMRTAQTDHRGAVPRSRGRDMPGNWRASPAPSGAIIRRAAAPQSRQPRSRVEGRVGGAAQTQPLRLSPHGG